MIGADRLTWRMVVTALWCALLVSGCGSTGATEVERLGNGDPEFVVSRRMRGDTPYCYRDIRRGSVDRCVAPVAGETSSDFMLELEEGSSAGTVLALPIPGEVTGGFAQDPAKWGAVSWGERLAVVYPAGLVEGLVVFEVRVDGSMFWCEYGTTFAHRWCSSIKPAGRWTKLTNAGRVRVEA